MILGDLRVVLPNVELVLDHRSHLDPFTCGLGAEARKAQREEKSLLGPTHNGLTEA